MRRLSDRLTTDRSRGLVHRPQKPTLGLADFVLIGRAELRYLAMGSSYQLGWANSLRARSDAPLIDVRRTTVLDRGILSVSSSQKKTKTGFFFSEATETKLSTRSTRDRSLRTSRQSTGKTAASQSSMELSAENGFADFNVLIERSMLRIVRCFGWCTPVRVQHDHARHMRWQQIPLCVYVEHVLICRGISI